MFQSFHSTLSCLVAALLIIGTIGYSVVEHWGLFDSLYMTIITMSTVGYGEVHKLSSAGKAFSTLLIVASVLIMTCWTSCITSYWVSSEIDGRFKRKRARKMICNMKNHVVVFGNGVDAIWIVRGLVDSGLDIVLVTSNDIDLGELEGRIAVLKEDPRSEIAFADANVFSASHMVIAMDTDFDNLLLAISATSLGADASIICLAREAETSSRLLKLGADQVICPTLLCSERISTLVSEPVPQEPALQFEFKIDAAEGSNASSAY